MKRDGKEKDTGSEILFKIEFGTETRVTEPSDGLLLHFQT